MFNQYFFRRVTLIQYVLLVMLIVSFTAAFYKVGTYPSASLFVAPPLLINQETSTSEFSSRFVSSKAFTAVHASSIIELNDKHLRAFWFSGTREGASDVTINTAVFDLKTSDWSNESVIASRESTQAGLHRYISKLGNPVPMRASDGRLWVFYVTVSLGGWAGSSITAIISDDNGLTWSTPHRLITSPFINISTLIKGTPFLYQDGTMGLPVYHEFIAKFPEILRIDNNGNVLDKQRLTPAGYGAIQPVISVQDEQNAFVLMRNSKQQSPRYVRMVSTSNAGQTWQKITDTELPNSDSALSTVVLQDGRLLAVMNNQEKGRENLSLMLSDDNGISWYLVKTLEDQLLMKGTKPGKHACLSVVENLVKQSDPKVAASIELTQRHVDSAKKNVNPSESCNFEFSYPYLIQTQNGTLHLSYTWNRAFIKHTEFNLAWLTQQINENKQ